MFLLGCRIGFFSSCRSSSKGETCQEDRNTRGFPNNRLECYIKRLRGRKEICDGKNTLNSSRGREACYFLYFLRFPLSLRGTEKRVRLVRCSPDPARRPFRIDGGARERRLRSICRAGREFLAELAHFVFSFSLCNGGLAAAAASPSHFTAGTKEKPRIFLRDAPGTQDDSCGLVASVVTRTRARARRYNIFDYSTMTHLPPRVYILYHKESREIHRG